jgi:hypothetical protein
MLEKGRAAGRLLMDSSEQTRPRTVMLDTEMVLGKTSARPHSAEERWFGP